MKILMTLPFPGLKGPLNEHIPLLIDELEKQGVEIERFYYGRRKQEIFFAIRIAHLFSNLFGFFKLIIFKKVHIIQLNTSFDRDALLRDLLFVITTWLARKKVFLKIHGSFYNLLYTKNVLWFLYACSLFALTHRIGVLSVREKYEFCNVFSRFKDKFLVVKNPIDTVTPIGHSNRLQEMKNRFRILYASRIIREKGIFDLISAMPAVIKEINAQFVIAGSGRDETEARSLLEKMDLSYEKNVIWLGDVPSQDMKNIFNSVDMFVFPTHFPEGMPMALVNAMALGLPLVTTKVRFAYDYLREPHNCLFIKQNNPRDLADKICYMYRHPEVMQNMSKNNRQLDKIFNKETVSGDYLNLYNELYTKTVILPRKEKGLFIVPLPPPYAGPEVASKILIDALPRNDFDMILLCNNVHLRNKDKGKVDVYSTARFIFLTVQIFILALCKRPKFIYTLLSQNLTGFMRDSVVIIICNIFRIKVILHFHGSNFKSFYLNRSRYVRTYISYILKKVDGIIIQAAWLKDVFSTFVKGNKLQVIYNPICNSQFSTENRKDKYQQHEGVKVLYFSNISVAKGFLVMVKAMLNIIAEEDDIEFIIAGGIIQKERNILYDQLGDRIPSQDVKAVITDIKNNILFGSKISFLGEVTNLGKKQEIFKEADIFVLPSYSEGCPMVVLEAMSAGLPVITTPVGALTEIIEDSVNGFFIPIGDSDQLKRKILLLASDPSLRKEMGLHNKELIKHNFELDKVIPQFNDFFSEVVRK